jgi:hypothetical protein
MKRFGLPAVAVAVVGFFLFGWIAAWRDGRRGVERTEALLRGDRTARLESFDISYQQRRVHCTDPEVLRYFESCFREGDPRYPNRGGMVTYLLRLEFEGGGRLEALTYWSEGGFRLYMPYQSTDTGEEPRGSAWFQPPVPAPVREMIDFLNEDSPRARGQVLILEPGARRRERDAPLPR